MTTCVLFSRIGFICLATYSHDPKTFFRFDSFFRFFISLLRKQNAIITALTIKVRGWFTCSTLIFLWYDVFFAATCNLFWPLFAVWFNSKYDNVQHFIVLKFLEKISRHKKLLFIHLNDLGWSETQTKNQNGLVIKIFMFQGAHEHIHSRFATASMVWTVDFFYNCSHLQRTVASNWFHRSSVLERTSCWFACGFHNKNIVFIYFFLFAFIMHEITDEALPA